MTDVVLGILAVLAGAVFCFRGLPAMRIVIAFWGAFAGFGLGAALVAAIGGDSYLSTALGWVVGVLVAILFAVLAYLYYAVAVVLAMASAGFALGAGATVALGVTWNWVIVLVGVLIGIALAVFALAVDLPAMLLVIVSALGGAVAIVGGAMLLTGVLDAADFGHASITRTIDDDWWWYAFYLLLAVAGVVAQLRFLGRERSLRAQWQRAPERHQTA
ncbi:DUF4203 domain-containing protein [Rhodococcus hoagii]|jgi:hypothetical protein|uniref:DUF4203 domain-containing protein n=2 Tax=Rhodococcus hoagii TaxID=43767 RepID=A0AAE2WAX9_RHOHA|nr:DUF4203 domain-containing protein [Prescottella equi]GBF14995.1 hypothetical protein Br6_02371 [Rhodococcus sp. Br-6]MBM4484369.1 DUF4203 domain-containing protein [Prescottella equi]MBM4510511.1 DUF4203 domain-containing protein [Prescottella equi]MBM4536491.1 DUF4203 domain-containing protein [Prescottella equi]MBM4540385.1 DUF4203 domain-containing protein [Prescottella equi]